MDKDTEQIILDIKTNFGDSIMNIAKYTRGIEELQAENKNLKKQMKEEGADRKALSETIAVNKLAIDKNRESVRMWTNDIKNNVKEAKAYEDSIKSMRKEASSLTSQYYSLSKAERESAKGMEMQEKINSLKKDINEAERSLGNFTSNVGNYEADFASALAPLIKQLETAKIKFASLSEEQKKGAEGQELTKNIKNLEGQLQSSANAASIAGKELTKLTGINDGLLSSISSLVGETKNIPTLLSALKVGIMGVGKSLLALLANPIVLTIAAIVGAIAALVAIFSKVIDVAKGNEEQFSKLQVVMAPLTFLTDKITNVFEGLADIFISVSSAVMGAIVSFTDWIGLTDDLKGKTNEYMQVEKDKLKLVQDTRKANEDAALSDQKVSELKNKVAQKDKFTHEQRIAFLDEAIEMENKTASERERLAIENLRLLEIEGNRAKNSAEFEQKLSDARIAVTRATTDLNNKTKEMNAQRVEAINAMKAETKAEQDKLKAKQDLIKEQKAKELELIRQAEDAALAIVKDGIAKQTKIINIEYDRQIADLKTKLTTEKNLTSAAIKAINDTIISLEKQRQVELDQLSDQAIQDRVQKETDRIQLQLDAVKEGTTKEHNLRLSLIEQNRQAELAANKQLAEELRQSESDINAVYNKQIADEDDSFRKQQFDKQKEMFNLEWSNRLLKVREGSLEEYNLKEQQTKAEYDSIINMDATTKAALYSSDAEYENAKLQSERNMTDATKARIAAENEAAVQQISAISSMTDAFSSMIDSFAEDNEALAGFSKALALFNIGISTAEALARGIASAQSVPFPGNIVAIASTIAAIMANIVKAKQILSKEKEPKAPKFADGGDINGPSHASGGVLIEAEGGEGIINKHSMSNPLLRSIASAVNVAGGGVPFANVPALSTSPASSIDMSAIKEAFIEAVKELPNPIVSVQEINRGQRNVKVIENNASL